MFSNLLRVRVFHKSMARILPQQHPRFAHHLFVLNVQDKTTPIHRRLCSRSGKTSGDDDVFPHNAATTTDWRKLCSDSNPSTIAFLDKHWDTIQDKIKWPHLCCNPAAIPLLLKHWDTIQDKIDFACLGVCNENVIPLLDKHVEELKMSGAIDYFWINGSPDVISWLKRHYRLQVDAGDDAKEKK